MKSVVTGAAGFIGSHLCEKLLEVGDEVYGIDAFIPYYSAAIKKSNLTHSLDYKDFHFHQIDLRTDSLDDIIADAEIVYHLAAMPGLIRSWEDFDGYWTCNVQATQRLLESVRRCPTKPKRLVLVSTSSVYGRHATGNESLPTKPVSPYGVTKLAAENLCQAYVENYGIPVVTLRYFSVYGPRQRPDMAYHKFMRALLSEEPITIFGDGQQVRGNTYIDDCVAATMAAANATQGEIYNVGGGETATVLGIVRKLEALSGRRAIIEFAAARPGDQQQTGADTTKLRLELAWEPRTKIDDGLARQWDWQQREHAKWNDGL